MNETSYPFALSHHEFRYEFVSTSQEKEVRKVVLITQTENPGIFNLALLDLLESGALSDLTQPDNKDFRKVLATVYRIMLDFFIQKPSSLIVSGEVMPDDSACTGLCSPGKLPLYAGFFLS